MIISIILSLAAIAIALYAAKSCRKQESELSRLRESYGEAAEEYMSQAAKTERMMQDGISSILNYDALSSLRGENK